MKKITFIALLILSFKMFSQPDSFSTTIYDSNYGELNVVLYKYSTRGPNYQIFLYDGNDLTPYPVPEIRTYRGYIENLENSKITAIWYPDGKLYLKLFAGKGEKYGFQLNEIDIDGLTITELDLPIVEESKKAELHLTSGYTTNYEWMVETANGNVENAIAIFENGVNQYDLSIARDIGTSMSIDLVVIPTEEVELFNPKNSDYPDLNVTNTWWKCYGGGGGAGRHNYCSSTYKGGRTSLYRAGFGAMPHEFGHTLDLGHHHNQHDAMHSNQFYLGRDNAIRAREHLGYNGAVCLEVDNPDYTDPIQPYTPEDYAVTFVNESVEIDVLSNDVDYNGEAVSLYEFDNTSYYGGAIEQVGQSLLYTPSDNFFGKDFFFYKAKSGNVQDNTFFWNIGLVSIDVRDTQDLLLHYPFEETTGNVIFNQTNASTQYNANVIQGTMDAMSNGNGIVGNSIAIGQNQMIGMNDILDPLSSSSTVSIWFNLGEFPDSNRKLIFDSGSRGRLTLSGLSIAIEENQIQFFAQHEGKDNTGGDRYGIVNWETNKWYHAVLVVDRTSNKIFGYLDGVEVGNSSFSQNLKNNGVIKGYPGIKGRISTGVGAQCKGKPWENTKDQFIGRIDELKIYGKALLETEILDEFNNPDGGNYSCFTGLFDESIRNSSFEKNIIKINSQKDKLLFDWYATDDSRGHVLWSGFSSDIPNAPDGDNWGSIGRQTAIYQQIGIWEPNKDYTVNFVYGKRSDANNSDLEVSLWVGSSDYPEKNRHLNDIGAQKIDARLIDSSELSSVDTIEKTIELSTNGQSYGCVPIWIMFENKNGNNQTVNLVDDIFLYDEDDTLSVEDESYENDILVYPNPTEDIIYVKSEKSPITNMELVDLRGRVIITIKKDFYEKRLNLSSMSSGIYFLNIRSKEKTISKKVIRE